MIGNSARIGAAVVAVGMSVVAPHGVAAADGDADGTETASVAQRGTHQERPVLRSGRGGSVVGVAQSRAVVTPERVSAARTRALPNAAGATRVRSLPVPSAAPRAPLAAARVATRSAAAVPPRIQAAAADSPALPGTPAPAAQKCGSCWAFGSTDRTPAAGGLLVSAIVREAHLLDRIDDWLSTLPSRPVVDFLSGALLMVRRTMFPHVHIIPGVSVSNVVVAEDCSDLVFTVTLDRAYSSMVSVGYATESALTHRGAEPADLAERATAGTDYEPTSGILTFAPGETAQQVHVTILADTADEMCETFTLNIFATYWPDARAMAATTGRAAATATDKVTSVVLASATASIVDDDRVKIDVNPNFAYGDALLASVFSDLAYNHRDAADFASRVQATGWQGIGISSADLGKNSYSPAAGGYGVRDGLSMQSFAFAGKRTAADGTEQFVVAFEGSNSPTSEPADWVVNVAQYGWSRYYASLEPLMAEVVGQMLQAQADQKRTQLIITGHSLGGATAMMAFADLLAPQGNLWPGTSDVLSAGRRVLDAVDGWSTETRTALLAATSVYTFGAPSILVEPTKLGAVETAAFVALAPVAGALGSLALLARTIGMQIGDSKQLPNLTGVAGITFGTRVFQFEHANTSWTYPGDIVAQIGSRDPGTVLEINLDDEIHKSYTSWLTRYVPGGTHPMANYQQSIIRLITNKRLLKNPNQLSGTTPQLTQTAKGNGSDARNDFFVNLSDDGKKGNDLFAFTQEGSYSANGGEGSDTYSITAYNVSLLIDGAAQSGRDTIVFDVAGTMDAKYSNSGAGPLNDTAVFSVTGTGGQRSSVTISHWDQWQVSDIFQVIKPAGGSWSLNAWTNIDRGPVAAVMAASEVPLSVL